MLIIAQVTIPEVVDVGAGVQAVIVQLGSVVLVTAGGALAFMALRKALRWAVMSDWDQWDGVRLDQERHRITHKYEQAALAGDEGRARFWADKYEEIWGEEASAEMQAQVNEEHQLWKR